MSGAWDAGHVVVSWYCGSYSYCVVSCGGYWVKLRVVVSSSCAAGRVSALVELVVIVSSSWEVRRDSQHSLS